jgi:hypothetical protein
MVAALPVECFMQRLIAPRTTRASLAWLRVLGCLAAGVFALGASRVQGEASKEYQVKAAFLFNFAQFVEWPTNTFTNTEEPFTIGILGADPFGQALDETVQGEMIQKHRMIIRRSPRIEDLQGCQILFISKSEKSRVTEILPKLGTRILTVSEVQGFTSHGGVINFYLEGSKVRFEINPVSARHEGLKISSQLLSVGKVVESEPASEGK